MGNKERVDMTLSFIFSFAILLTGVIYLGYIRNFTNGLGLLHSLRGSVLTPHVTVIVPARNEEQTIGHCLRSLLAQDYPGDKVEILVVDDQSSDGTAAVVACIGRESSRIRMISVTDRPADRSPKINALERGLEESTGEIILTTDADCTARPAWISTMLGCFTEDTGVVTGTTVYRQPETGSLFLYGIQFIDFLSHTACAAGSIGNGKVNNCNGSNFSFRKTAFEQAGGFASLAHINSGDDSLLAQIIAERTEWKVRFALDRNAIIETHPVETWRTFFQQRMRWAGQTSDYPHGTMVFLISTFLLYILLFSSFTYLLSQCFAVLFADRPFHPFSSLIAITTGSVFLAKVFFDWRILRTFTGLTGTSSAMKYFVPAELIHIPIILYSVFGGYFGSFEWKGRQFERTIK